MLKMQASISSVDEALDMQRRGARTRQKAGTALNYASSRSHAVFIIMLYATEATREQDADVRTHLTCYLPCCA